MADETDAKDQAELAPEAQQEQAGAARASEQEQAGGALASEQEQAGAAQALEQTGPAPAPLAPRERRARARAARAARTPVRGPLTPEERRARHEEQRRAKALARRRERERERSRRRQRAAGDQAAVAPPAREHGPGRQKTRQGVVVSNRAQKTLTVRIDVARRHRRYGKIVRTSTTLHAHDERGEASIGDTVVVRECRPLSATKRWRLVAILERAQ